MVNNKEIFEEFYRFCKEHSIEEVIKEYGGGEIYVPSYKSTHRDEEIYKRYKSGESLRVLAREYNLSISRVRAIIRRYKQHINHKHHQKEQKP